MTDWQNIAALMLVALAVTYIVWRVARKVAKRAGSRCGGCASCGPTEGSPQANQFVSLQPQQQTKRD